MEWVQIQKNVNKTKMLRSVYRTVKFDVATGGLHDISSKCFFPSKEKCQDNPQLKLKDGFISYSLSLSFRIPNIS